MMQEINREEEADLWKQVQEQFEKLKLQTGIEPDENYQKELDEILGLSDEDFQEIDENTRLLLSRKNVQVQLLDNLAVYPKYAYPTDSGFDLHSTIEYTLPSFGRAIIPTGIKVSFDEGLELQIRPKSGLAINQGITVLNTPGTVDAGYTGELKVIVFNTNKTDFTITKGMKIAQAVFAPVINGRFINFHTVSEVEEKDRGNNGFGSTGI
jgi:dUTP pyrophosphatase